MNILRYCLPNTIWRTTPKQQQQPNFTTSRWLNYGKIVVILLQFWKNGNHNPTPAQLLGKNCGYSQLGPNILFFHVFGRRKKQPSINLSQDVLWFPPFKNYSLAYLNVWWYILYDSPLKTGLHWHRKKIWVLRKVT